MEGKVGPVLKHLGFCCATVFIALKGKNCS